MTEPLLGFSPQLFFRRRTSVFQELQGGALVLPSSPLQFRSRDTELRYRPDSELFYLTGCTAPAAVAVLLDREEERFVLFLPEPEPEAEIWTGPRLRLEEAKEIFGADAVYPHGELSGRLPGLLKGSERVFFRLDAHDSVQPLVLEALRVARNRGGRKGEGPRGVVDPGVLLDDLRLLKDPEEIQRIRRATDLTVEAFREVMSTTRPGMGEWEVEARLESAIRRGGGRGPGFPTIVGSGPNGCVMHYTENGRRLTGGELVLVDGGAEVDLYAGDVTRTYPCGGRFEDRQRDVYRVVLGAHRAAVSAVRPGTPVDEIHQAVLVELTSGLVDLGVLDGEVENLIQDEAYKPFFPHQTSHWLGLDIHDVGDYARDGSARALEPGMVLTVEPGLYFSGSEDRAPNPYTGLGVRIEDDLLVTDDGCENLTSALPVDPEAVEELAKGG